MSLEGALYVEPETVQGEVLQRRIKTKRIAVILPVAYRGISIYTIFAEKWHDAA